MRRCPAMFATLALGLAACGGDGGDGGESVTLVTHNSFAVSEGLLEDFTDETGIEVEVLRAGDAGSTVNQAILTRDNPQGDVLFGIDNTFLTRAFDEELFVAYESPRLDDVDPQYLLDPEFRVTPIDHGDVCLNYDRAFFEAEGIPVPETLDELADPAYDGLLVVENPATSSPGLAFVLATISRFGEDGWLDFWSALRANDVAVAEGWEDAYYGQFSGSSSGTGDRPLVVSYASSPPAEVVFAEEPIDESPVGVIADSCFQQVEFAGILAGSENEEAARELIDFMLSPTFQEDMPLNMFVFPVSTEAKLPEVFVEHTVVPEDPFVVAPEEIGANRDRWIDEWTDTVLR